MPQDELVKLFRTDPELIRLRQFEGMKKQVERIRNAGTEVSNHLVKRLDGGNPIKELWEDAEEILKQEGTRTPYKQVNPLRIKRELEMVLDPQVSEADIRFWVREEQEFFEAFTWSRLYWMWDFSWCYFLKSRYFKERDFLLYGAIRGEPPDRSRNMVFQAGLTYELKKRRQKRDRKILTLAKQKDLKGLMELGFTESVAKHAISKVDRVSG